MLETFLNVMYLLTLACLITNLLHRYFVKRKNKQERCARSDRRANMLGFRRNFLPLVEVEVVERKLEIDKSRVIVFRDTLVLLFVLLNVLFLAGSYYVNLFGAPG
jgi:hypothetical protein